MALATAACEALLPELPPPEYIRHSQVLFQETAVSRSSRLRPDLRWSDGSPVTAEDVVFTHSYCTHPEGACAQLAKFAGVTAVEARR